MNTLSIKKLSILGLVLIAASAVTAAIVPSKSKSNVAPKLDRGGLVDSTLDAPLQTCTLNGGNECNVTAGTGTTEAVGSSAHHTTNNTHD